MDLEAEAADKPDSRFQTAVDQSSGDGVVVASVIDTSDSWKVLLNRLGGLMGVMDTIAEVCRNLLILPTSVLTLGVDPSLAESRVGCRFRGL